MDNTNSNSVGVGHDKLSPKFFFLSLGVLVSLIASVTSFLNLAFSTLDKKFPDVLNATYQYGYNTYDYTAMRSALSMLIIFFPVFLLLSYFWTRMVIKNLGRIDDVIKKWMLYLVVFLSSVVVIVDLVMLVQYFVSGEITSRFIYKVIITLLVALFVGSYYILELMNRRKLFGMPVGITSAIKSSAWVVILVILSFMVMGSPAQQRTLRMDDRRVQDLQTIQYQVINYWQQKEKLPEKIENIANPLSGFSLPVDPEFEKGLKYEYIKTGDLSFQLCSTFSADMPKGWREYSSGGGIAYPVATDTGATSPVKDMYPYPGYGVNDSWDHKIGRTCFDRTIDKDIYPPYPKPVTQ
jgi:hypothetical protein